MDSARLTGSDEPVTRRDGGARGAAGGLSDGSAERQVALAAPSSAERSLLTLPVARCASDAILEGAGLGIDDKSALTFTPVPAARFLPLRRCRGSGPCGTGCTFDPYFGGARFDGFCGAWKRDELIDDRATKTRFALSNLRDVRTSVRRSMGGAGRSDTAI